MNSHATGTQQGPVDETFIVSASEEQYPLSYHCDSIKFCGELTNDRRITHRLSHLFSLSGEDFKLIPKDNHWTVILCKESSTALEQVSDISCADDLSFGSEVSDIDE